MDGAARNMPEIFEKALDLALEKRDPKKKLERRKKREAARSTTRLDEATRSETRLDEARPRTRPDEATEAKKRELEKREARAGSPAFQPPLGAQSSRLHPSRYIPSSVRERVLERADYQCEFRGPDGTRCAARVGLEIDHTKPLGKGGSRGEGNLRVLCRGHNLLAAAREFGEE